LTAPRPSWIREHLSHEERDLLRQCALAAVGVGIIMLVTCSMAIGEPAPGRESDIGKPILSSRARISQDANGNAVIVGRRPAGCPRRYCGCATSLHVFGKIKPELNLALNWARKFPRTSPASGMVAARSGHVMVLLSHVEGNDWMTFDPNSGGGLTREHVRSIRGFKIVNPHGAYAER
jgi:hypothetical protein